MATSDGISSEDWDRVHELAVDIANAIDEEVQAACRQRLFSYLDELEVKYGPLPSILATRADFTVDPQKSTDLLLRAYGLAEARGDRRNAVYIAHSLVGLYVEDLGDPVEARKWLDCLRRGLVEIDDSWLAEEYERLLDAIEELGAG